MSNWIVLVREYAPIDVPWLPLEDQPQPYNTHYMPIPMSASVPLHLTAFVAETSDNDVPVFDMTHAHLVLKQYGGGLPMPAVFAWENTQPPVFIKPYAWLDAQFGVQAIKSAHLYLDIYRTEELLDYNFSP